MRIISSAVACIVLIGAAQAHDPHARATYLGNEGVMVARGDTKILFDAFYADSYGQYTLVPDDIVSAMLDGAAPYDGVDAIFVSHVHGDHFTAAPAIDYLRAYEDVALYASVQIRDAILSAGVSNSDPILARIHTYDLGPTDDPVSFAVGDLDVSVVAVPHAGDRPEIQNFVWRVTLDDDTTVMHLGDAGTVISDFERHAAHFAGPAPQAAFPPYWFFLDDNGRTILETYIRAEQTVGVHVPAAATGNGDQARSDVGGDLFTDPGETRDIGSAHHSVD